MPRSLERLGRLARELVPERGQGLLASVDQDHPDRRGLERTELAPQAAGGQLSDLAGQLDSGGSGSDHHEGQPVLLLGRVGDHLGHLEGTEDPPPQLECVVEGLHPRCEERELLVPEVRLGHPGRHDEAVVGILDGHAPGHVGVDHPALEVEATHLGQLHPHVLLPSHDVPQGRGDLTRGEHSGGRLVEQGLEEVVIAPVDQGHVDRLPTEQPGGRQSAESAADDDHPMARCAIAGATGVGCGGVGPGSHQVRSLEGLDLAGPRPSARFRRGAGTRSTAALHVGVDPATRLVCSPTDTACPGGERTLSPARRVASHNPGLLCMMPPSTKMVVAVR